MSLHCQLHAVPRTDVGALLAGEARAPAPDAPAPLRLFKRWHAIDTMLAMTRIKPGLTKRGTSVVGWGAAGCETSRAWMPTEVGDFVREVDMAGTQRIASAFDFEAFERRAVYPPVWHHRSEDDRRHTVEALERTVAFARAAQERGDGLLTGMG